MRIFVSYLICTLSFSAYSSSQPYHPFAEGKKKALEKTAQSDYGVKTRMGTLGGWNFQRDPGNPILGTAQGFTITNEGCVLYDESQSRYRLWFDGVDPAFNVHYSVYHATSADLVNWTIDTSGPVLTSGSPGEFDQDAVRCWSVIKDNTQYFMYYFGKNSGIWQSGVATSSDGLHWTKFVDNPILPSVNTPGSWERNFTGWGDVLKEGSVFKMWYGGSDNVSRDQSGYATSFDGLHWTKYPGNPVFRSGSPGSWDEVCSVLEAVFSYGGVYYGFYVGSASGNVDTAAMGVAYSTDGIHWTKDEGNPVLCTSDGGWDDAYVGVSDAYVFGDSVRIWYSGYPGTFNWQVGTAAAAIVPLGRDKGFTASILVEDQELRSAELLFGTMGGATDGLDSIAGEEELPPKPPAGNFDARWLIGDTQGSVKDIRDTLGSGGTIRVYTGDLQTDPSGYPMILRWDRSKLQRGSFVLRDKITGGSYYSIDMSIDSTFSLSGTTPVPFEVLYSDTGRVYLTLSPDMWNMISLPVQVPDRRPEVLFPTAVSKPFRYEGGYLSTDTMEYGAGYWMKFDIVGTLGIRGIWFDSDTIPVRQGWNMIGSVSRPVQVADILEVPDGIVKTHYYSYSGGYDTASTIEPMRAYWVKVKQDGELMLTAYGNLARPPSPAKRDGVQMNRLVIRDIRGRTQMLYFGSSTQKFNSIEDYDLPPPPPEGSYDVRYSTGTCAEFQDENEARSIPVRISSASYPLRIEWSGNLDGAASLFVGEKEIVIRGEGSVLVSSPDVGLTLQLGPASQKPLPEKISLLQNFPNPFNPTTRIGYSIPVDDFVSINVYSTLGERVDMLVHGWQTAGYHSVQWDGLKRPTGIYWYQLRCGMYSETRKMLLVK